MLVLMIVMAGTVTACTSETEYDYNDCYKHVQRSFSVSLPAEDPMIDYAANVCRVDADQCNPLCAAILIRLQISADPVSGINNVADTTMSSCSVRFDSSEVDVDIGYQIFDSTNSNCLVPAENF